MVRRRPYIIFIYCTARGLIFMYSLIFWQRAANRLARIGAMVLLSMVSGILPTLAQTAAPTAPATAQTTAVKPVIHAQLNGSPLDGTASSYCWPQPGQNPCVLVGDPQPSSFTPVKPGDLITFSVDPGADAPATFIGQLLDDPDASGSPTQIDLTNSKGLYSIDPTLPSGSQRIEVQVSYPPAPDGSQNYVAYVFGLEVPNSSIAANGTGTAAASASAIAAVPTEVTATAISSTANTQESTSSGSATSAKEPTNTGTSVPAKATTQTPTATVPPTMTVAPTATPIPPTNTPTAIPPTDTPTEVPSPTAVPGISVLTSSPNGIVPTLSLLVGGKTFNPVAITAVLQDSSGALITVTRPLDTSTPFVIATAGSDAQVQFSGPQPVSELITLLSADASKVIVQQPITAPNTLILYTLPAKAGLYALYVAVQWPQGQATYIFRLQIT